MLTKGPTNSTTSASLSDPLSLIAIVQVTAVKLPEVPNVYPLVDLRVEQLLRGSTEKTKLQAESRWIPPPPSGNRRIFFSSGPLPTTFDSTEPAVGNRFLVGFWFISADQGRARISGAIDLHNPDQTRLVPDVERFLTIEAASGDYNAAPFLFALNDPLPWMRDLAALRIVRSTICATDPACQSAFLDEAEKRLHSKEPADRWEALQWLASPAFAIDGGWIFSQRRIHEILVAAQSDPNLWIGDEAFRKTELLDFSHAGQAGECITVVPYLRLSLHWISGESDISRMPGTTICNSAPPASDHE